MKELTTEPRTRLVTTFGGYVFVDTASGQLRHGPIDSKNANVVLVACRSEAEQFQAARLMHEPVAGLLQPIICTADGCWCFSETKTYGASRPTSFQLLRLDRGLIALKSGGLYLCAEHDGRVTLSRKVCSHWEIF